jgi:hypothetical protein
VFGWCSVEWHARLRGSWVKNVTDRGDEPVPVRGAVRTVV